MNIKLKLKYLSLEKFKSIVPLTLTLFIVKIFSSQKLFVNEVNRNMVAAKKIRIYFFEGIIEHFNNK